MITMSTIFARKNVYCEVHAEVNGVQEIHMNPINYVIKVTQAQVFVASTKIWQMRLVEQLAVWHILFKANF